MSNMLPTRLLFGDFNHSISIYRRNEYDNIRNQHRKLSRTVYFCIKKNSVKITPVLFLGEDHRWAYDLKWESFFNENWCYCLVHPFVRENNLWENYNLSLELMTPWQYNKRFSEKRKRKLVITSMTCSFLTLRKINLKIALIYHSFELKCSILLSLDSRNVILEQAFCFLNIDCFRKISHSEMYWTEILTLRDFQAKIAEKRRGKLDISIFVSINKSIAGQTFPCPAFRLSLPNIFDDSVAPFQTGMIWEL
jgi:hypothetical protein